MSRLRLAVVCISVTLLPLRALAAPSFIYVAAPVCPSDPCASEVLVYDAATTGLVTRIALGNARPFALAVSKDGRRLYVSTLANTVIVIDATHHVVLGAHAAPAGRLAVSRDGARLFIASGNTVSVYDTATDTIVSSLEYPLLYSVTDAATSPAADRFYTTQWDMFFRGLAGSTIDEYDTAAVPAPPTATTSSQGEIWWDLYPSRDGARLYATGTIGVNPPSQSSVTVLNAPTLASLGRFTLTGRAVATADSVLRRRIYTVAVPGMDTSISPGVHVRDFDTLAAVGFVPAPGGVSIAISADEARAWLATARTSSSAGSADALHTIDLATNAIATTIALPGTPSEIVATPPGASADVCNYRVNTTQSSWTVNGGTASIALKTPCTWVASSDAPWARLDAASGIGNATLTLSVDQNFTTTNRSATLTIGGRLVTVTQASFSATPAFGVIDTPAENSAGVTGALTVSGWALDDVGVTRVEVFRDPVAGEPAGAPVFIGDATFVEGARPDVQAAYPALPYASRAGWGLQILTNMLPGQGNGTYRLLVFADDVEGHTTLLGTRTFTAANATAALPFGTIDTPGQGQTVSGTIINFGWALTPQPKVIPMDGSTIDVLIDGVVVGHPTYGFARADIQAAFPGYANTDGAVGYFILDTTTLTDGLHSIAWVVRDNMGATQGIGSRFFTVANQ